MLTFDPKSEAQRSAMLDQQRAMLSGYRAEMHQLVNDESLPLVARHAIAYTLNAILHGVLSAHSPENEE